jgi:hypothetical protein
LWFPTLVIAFRRLRTKWVQYTRAGVGKPIFFVGVSALRLLVAACTYHGMEQYYRNDTKQLTQI